MRRLPTLLIIAAFAAAPALAEPAAPDPAIAFYPPQARTAGVEGEATIRCARDVHLALVGCSLISETPAGHGFGAAALAMAAASQDNPKLSVTDPSLLKPAEFTIKFRLGPPSVQPDISGMSHVLTRPRLLHSPSAQDMAPYVPVVAVSTTGHVDLTCRIGADEHPLGCEVLDETPTGLHLGDAAKRMAEHLYRISPGLLDGEPDPQAEVQIPIDFGAPLPPPAPPPPALLAFYPPAALAGRVGGEAQLRCRFWPSGAPSACKVVAETPRDYGFGAAAIAMLAAAPTCAYPATKTVPPADYFFRFTASPPSILPDIFGPDWPPPRWLREPTGDDFRALYPAAAWTRGHDGRVVLACRFAADGRLSDCQAQSETPSGEGFGWAALKLSTRFQAAPENCDGKTLDGKSIKIPIRFVAPHY